MLVQHTLILQCPRISKGTYPHNLPLHPLTLHLLDSSSPVPHPWCTSHPSSRVHKFHVQNYTDTQAPPAPWSTIHNYLPGQPPLRPCHLNHTCSTLGHKKKTVVHRNRGQLIDRNFSNQVKIQMLTIKTSLKIIEIYSTNVCLFDPNGWPKLFPGQLPLTFTVNNNNKNQVPLKLTCCINCFHGIFLFKQLYSIGTFVIIYISTSLQVGTKWLGTYICHCVSSYT